MSSSRPLLVLIDGHALAYRVYFAISGRNFLTQKGEPTNATFGFTRILLDIILNQKPDYLAVAFDRGLSNREAIYSDYKANRDEMPDDLRIQLNRIHEVVDAFNIPIMALDGYEADDVIGTIIEQSRSLDIDVRIITGDRDILQLLDDYVTVQMPQRGGGDVIYDVGMFREKYEALEPAQLIDLKALMGDASDNIPGVKGIGEKTGIKLLQKYETLDLVYKNIDEIKGAIQRKLIEGKELAYLSRKLATIMRDVPITLDLEACVTHECNWLEVDNIFAELEFRTFRDKIHEKLEEKSENAIQFAEELIQTIIIQDEISLKNLIHILEAADLIVWDVETSGLDHTSTTLVGISLSVDGETAYYIPLAHGSIQSGAQMALFSPPHENQLALETVLEALRPALQNPKIAKVAHNASFDYLVMKRQGLEVKPIVFDTMIAEWVINPISRFLGLKNLVRQRLNIYMREISELIGSGAKQITMAQIAVEDAAKYAAADAAMTFRLIAPLKEELAEKHLLTLMDTLEVPLIPVVAQMEEVGVMVDTEFLSAMSVELGLGLNALETEIYALADTTFNINSPKQVNDVLFDKLKLSTEGLKKTSQGYSTDIVTLEILRDAHPIIEKIIAYRELTKLKSTYVDALPQLISPVTHRLHTSYNQTGTATGRFSSTNPNLQNIPIRTEIGRDVRRAFIAPEGKMLLAVDYSQIELRVMAHISQDPGLIQAFQNNADIHRATAATVFGIEDEAVSYEQRSFAKKVNFGLMYGMGAFRLARDSELTFAEAEKFIQVYFESFPGVRRYIDEMKEQASEQGFLTTLLGRRRDFQALAAGRGGQTAAAEFRAAINFPIQGSAADILKLALLHLYEALEKADNGSRMILQVHDEIVLEVPEAVIDETAKLVVDVMQSAYALDVPLIANAEIGRDWRDMN